MNDEHPPEPGVGAFPAEQGTILGCYPDPVRAAALHEAVKAVRHWPYVPDRASPDRILQVAKRFEQYLGPESEVP